MLWSVKIQTDKCKKCNFDEQVSRIANELDKKGNNSVKHLLTLSKPSPYFFVSIVQVF